MTKKDYEAIAKVLKNRIAPYLEPNTDIEAYSLGRGICEDITEVFIDDNPLFNKDRFLTACGFTN